MSDIRTAITNLVSLQEDLSISSPVSSSIKRAYNYTPNMASALPDTPCWLNTWTLQNQELDIGLRILTYTIRMQLMVFDADFSRAADICSAYMTAFITAHNADITLDSSVTQCALRGGDPTLGVLSWAGQEYVGLDLYLDCELKSAVSVT